MKALTGRYAIPIAVAMALLLLPLTLADRAAAATGFVTASGTRFVLDGQTFPIAGTNSHYLGWGTHAEVDSMLTEASQSDYTVVRTILHSVIGSLDGTTKPSVWNPNSTADASNMGMHGTYLVYWDTATNTYKFNDSMDTGLGRWDYVIWKAKQLGLKLNIAMLDFWQWAGGVQQVNSWYLDNYNPSSDANRYKYFFENATTKQFYKDWTAHVLNRTNTLTGVKYKDEPTVFAWDLMNEPEVYSVSVAQSWFQEMATHIKAQGAKQLVGTGSEGFYGGQAGSDPDTEPVNVPAVDFQTWHTYPTYHHISPQSVVDLVNRHCASARTAGKPVIMQEFAYPAQSAAEKVTRSGIYSSWLDAIYNNPDCAGWLYWRLEGKVIPAPTRAHPADDAVTPSSWLPDNGEGFSIYAESDTSKPQYDPAYAMFATQAQRLRNRTAASPSPSVPSSPSPSAPAGTSTADDSSGSWAYAGGWSHCTACNETAPAVYYNASQSWSLTTGDTATLSFTGTQVKYYAVKASHHGIAGVSIDGGAETAVDLYATAKTGDVLVWTSPTLSAGTHTLRIRNTGTKNAASTGTVVTLDRADVIGTAASPSPSVPPSASPSPSAQPSSSPGAPGFVKGVNFNGGAVTVEGHTWQASASAPGFGQTGAVGATSSLTPTPSADTGTASMLNTQLVASADKGTVTITQTVSNGSYQVYVWFMEPVQSNSRKFNVRLEGVNVGNDLGDLSKNQWRKYGPYTATVSDGVLTMDLVATSGKPMLSGYTITRL